MSYLKYPGMSPAEEAIMHQQSLIQNSLEHRANLAAAEKRAELRVVQEEDNRLLMQKILAENEIEARREEVRMRDESRKAMESELKTKFMSLPGSTESGWLAAKARLIENHFVELMNRETTFEEREREKYPMM